MTNQYSRMKIKYLLVLLSVCLLLPALCGCSPDAIIIGESSPVNDEPEIYFFAAGDADAILVTHQNFSMLVDCGNKGFGDTILAHLEECGIDRLDYLVITHFDKDHVGGAAQVLRSVPVSLVLQSVETEESNIPGKYTKALNKDGIAVQTVTQPTTLEAGGLTVEILPPSFETYGEKTDNNASLILSVIYGDNRVLLAGDAEDERLDEFISGCDGTYDLIKMPHHGKWSGSIKDLLETTQPSVAVICCEERSDVSDKTEKALNEGNVKAFFTGNGPVTAILTGNEITVKQN